MVIQSLTADSWDHDNKCLLAQPCERERMEPIDMDGMMWRDALLTMYK